MKPLRFLVSVAERAPQDENIATHLRRSVASLTQITPLPTASVFGDGREGRKEGESSFICWGSNPAAGLGYQRMIVMVVMSLVCRTTKGRGGARASHHDKPNRFEHRPCRMMRKRRARVPSHGLITTSRVAARCVATCRVTSATATCTSKPTTRAARF